MQGEYQKRTDSDGFTHVSYSGTPGARLRIKSGDVGLTTDEIIGNRGSYQSEEGYNEVLQDLEGGLTVTGAHLRPNGDVVIETNNGIIIEGKAAKVLYNNFFNSKVRGDDRTTTGDSGTSTIPTVTSNEALPTVELPVGNITAEMVNEENKKANERVETPQRPSNRYYPK